MAFGDDLKNLAPGQTVGSFVLNKNLKRLKKKQPVPKVGYQGKTITPVEFGAKPINVGAMPVEFGVSPTPGIDPTIPRRPQIYDLNDQIISLSKIWQRVTGSAVSWPGVALDIMGTAGLDADGIPFLFDNPAVQNVMRDWNKRYQKTTAWLETQTAGIKKTPETIKSMADQAWSQGTEGLGWLGNYLYFGKGRISEKEREQKLSEARDIGEPLITITDMFRGTLGTLGKAVTEDIKEPDDPRGWPLELAKIPANFLNKIGKGALGTFTSEKFSKEQGLDKHVDTFNSLVLLTAVGLGAYSAARSPKTELAKTYVKGKAGEAVETLRTLKTKAELTFEGIPKGERNALLELNKVVSEPIDWSMSRRTADQLRINLRAKGETKGYLPKGTTKEFTESVRSIARIEKVLETPTGLVRKVDINSPMLLKELPKLETKLPGITSAVIQTGTIPTPEFIEYGKLGLALIAGGAEKSTKISRLAKKTEERAIAEEVIDKPLKGLTEYEVRERDASIASAREFRAKNPEKGIKIALAQEQVPKGAGYLAGHMFKAVEKHAKDTKDVGLIKKLVSSPLAKGASKLGQEVQAYYDPEQDYSLVKIIKDVQESLEERVKTKAWRPGRVEVGRVAKEIETQLKLFELSPAKVNADEVVDKLAKKVETQVKPAKSLTDKKLEQKKVNELVNELFKIAKQTLPAKGKKTPKPVLSQVQEMFAKNERALETYESAKKVVQKKFAKNSEILEALTEYEATIPKTPVSKTTVTKAVREELKKNNIKLRDVIKTSIKEQKTTVEDITASLIKTGFSEKSAKVFGELAKAELQSRVVKTKASALKQITAAMGRKIPQSTLFEKIEKLNKLGALEDTDYLDLARARLGVDVSTEELDILVDLTTKLSETKADVDRTSVDGSNSRLEYGRTLAALQNYIATLKNPRLKMGLLRMAKDVSLAEVVMHPFQTTVGVFGLAKAMKATWDNSFVSRQGLRQMLSEPLIWKNQTIKSFKNIARTFGGAEVLDEFYARLYSSENALNGVYKAMGLDIGVFEEEIPTTIQEKIPVAGRVFKAADAAFTVFSQGSRADYADKLYKIAQETGTETTKKWFKDAGKLVGAFSSRAKLGRLEPVADIVNVTLFSGRKLKSDIDLLTMPFDLRLSPDIRKRAANNLLKYILGVAIILGIARALGGKVETNPLSADAGTVRKGSTRFVVSDIKSVVVLGARLSAWMYSYIDEDTPYFKSSITGKMTTRKDSTILSATGQKMVIEFLQNKLSPGFGLLSSFGQGEDWRGKPLTLEKEIKNLFVPIISQVPEEIGTQADSAPVLAALLAEFIGTGAQTYTSPDNPLIKLDKEWEADMAAKDKSGEFILTNKEKFNARFQWRKEISSYMDKLAKQRNKKAGLGWAEFRKLWNERNADLESEDISPDSDIFNQEVWDKELNKILRKHPAFSSQWDNIPQKLILR